jgi:hypothetical protein
LQIPAYSPCDLNSFTGLQKFAKGIGEFLQISRGILSAVSTRRLPVLGPVP